MLILILFDVPKTILKLTSVQIVVSHLLFSRRYIRILYTFAFIDITLSHSNQLNTLEIDFQGIENSFIAGLRVLGLGTELNGREKNREIKNL